MEPMHEEHMRRALALAERGRYATVPNPCVGAVLVKNGCVVAEGWHKRYGGPHAEREALFDARAKDVDPSGCEMYVTLEPCNHHGKTPPCTEAILEAGIKKVYVGARDPNRDVAGGGADMLRRHGVDVQVGVLEQACQDMIADFMAWKLERRAYLYLKMAMTLDGKIAGRDRKQARVTGPEAGQVVQALRGRVGAVLVGGGTLRADNPRLTCRVEGRDEHHQPLAVVVARDLPSADEALYLLRARAGETIFWTSEEAGGSDRAAELRDLGCEVWDLPRLLLRGEGEDEEGPADQEGRGALDLRSGLARLLAERKEHYVLCEGGGRLALSLVAQGLCDELWCFLAPRVLGDEAAVPVFAGRGAAAMDEAFDFRLVAGDAAGEDLLLKYRPRGRRE